MSADVAAAQLSEQADDAAAQLSEEADDAPAPALVHLSLDALSISSVRLCLEYPATDGTVTAVGRLIEGLNRAIDNVNVLEDESSAADAAVRQANVARQAELAVLVAEVAPRRAAALAALADALAAGAKAAQQLTDLEAAHSCIAGETMRLERDARVRRVEVD